MFRINTTSVSRAALVAAALIGATMQVRADNTAATPQLRREAVDLTVKAEIAAREVQKTAGMLERFAGTAQLTKDSHFAHLSQIRDLINDELRPALVGLQQMRSELPAWKQQSVDRMTSSAQLLAAKATAAIQAKKNGGAIPAPLNAEYRALLQQIEDHSKDLVKAADAAGELAKAQMKAVETGLPVL